MSSLYNQGDISTLLERGHFYFGLTDCEDTRRFNQHLIAQANQLNIEVHAEPTFEDFKQVVLAMDAQIEKKILAQLNKDFILIHYQISNVELNRLFKQNNSTLNRRVMAIWNYIATPDLQHWEALKQVLDAMVLLINNTQPLSPTPPPSLKLIPPKH